MSQRRASVFALTDSGWTAEQSRFEHRWIFVANETKRWFGFDFLVASTMMFVPVAKPDDQFLHRRFFSLLADQIRERLRFVLIRPYKS